MFSSRFFLKLLAGLLFQNGLQAGVHNLPVILVAREHKTIQHLPIDKLRVFRTGKDEKGEPIPIPIPFQIDEKDDYGDYILDQGQNPNSNSSNGKFDNLDELVFMGNDVGPRIFPKKWSKKIPRPLRLFEIVIKRGQKEGAVYIARYASYSRNLRGSKDHTLSNRRYVGYNQKKEEINTSRYRYEFNKDNYLVVRGVDVTDEEQKYRDLILSSTVFMKIDLKYFLTFKVGDDDIESDLDAIKIAPVRIIARVNFTYKVLKLKFDLGMYTEVSFFSNAVYLPAVIDNPLKGKDTLRSGSHFYYGLALVDNPGLTQIKNDNDLKIKTNMPSYKDQQGLLAWFKDKSKWRDPFWVEATNKDYMLYLEFDPSLQMKKSKNIPSLYRENTKASKIKSRNPEKAVDLGQGPSNLAVAFDLDKLDKGLHEVKFKLYIESRYDSKILSEYKTYDEWLSKVDRIPDAKY